MAKHIQMPPVYPIPQNWSWVELRQLTKVISGYPFDSKLFSDSNATGRPLIRIRDVVRGYTETYTTEECPMQYIIHKNDILIGMDGEFNVGKWQNEDALLNQRVCFIQSVSDLLLNDYLFYFLPKPLKQINDVTPSVTVKHLSTKTIESIMIPLPPLEEQKRLVALIESLFAKLDEASEKAQDVVDGFETRKAAILHKAFSGELYTTDSSSNLDELLSDIFSYRENLIKNKIIQRAKLKAMEDKDVISSFPSTWKQLKLGEISFVTKLAGFEYTKYIKLEESGDIPVVRAQNVRKGYLDTTNLLYIDRQTSENLNRSALDKPSILITFIGAGIGDVCVFDKPQRFHLAPNVAKVEPYCDENGAINIKFLLYYLLSPSGQKEIFKSMKAVAQPSLSMETIRDIVIPFTSKEEQDEIVRIVDNLISKEQQAKEAAESVIEQLDTMKKAILARAFRGELGTNDPSEESAVELLKQII